MEILDVESEPVPVRTSYLGRLLDVCGWKFLVFLGFSQFICKGALLKLVLTAFLPIFKTIVNVDAATQQVYMMIIMIPWSVKPILGLASDYVPICGFRKRGWLIIGLTVGILGSGVLMFTYTKFVIIAGLVCINFQVAMYDLLSESKYSELRNQNPRIGSDISTLVQGMQIAGVLVAMSFVGTFADRGWYYAIFVIAFCLSASPLMPTLLGWLPEKRVVDGSQMNRIHEDRHIILVVAFCGLSGIVGSLVSNGSRIAGLITCFALLSVCLIGCAYVLPNLITRIALYQVISIVAQPIIGSALDYYYTATPDCVPNGPHFTYAYYISWAGIVGTLISLAGVGIYQVFLSKLRFWPVLIITTFLGGLAGLSDLSLILHWNQRVGIPDHAAYIIGEAVLEPLIGILNWIPTSALISMAAPPGKEATCFAFLAGLSNFAHMVSELSGAVILDAVGLQSTGSCDFSALWWLVLVCHITLPGVIGVAAVFLLPNLRQDERVI